MRNGIEALIGEDGVVVRDIPPRVELGLVKIRGEEWTAQSAYNDLIKSGTIVNVIYIENGHLVVVAVDE